MGENILYYIYPEVCRCAVNYVVATLRRRSTIKTGGTVASARIVEITAQLTARGTSQKISAAFVTAAVFRFSKINIFFPYFRTPMRPPL